MDPLRMVLLRRMNLALTARATKAERAASRPSNRLRRLFLNDTGIPPGDFLPHKGRRFFSGHFTPCHRKMEHACRYFPKIKHINGFR